VKFGAIVTSIDGKVGGSVFQRSAYGHTLKNTPQMVKPNTIIQQTRKVSMFNSAKAWGALTQNNRDAWDTYAQSFPLASRKNPSSNLNGYNYFLKHNLLSSLANDLTPLADPSVTNLSFTFDTLSLTSNGSTTLVITFEYTSDSNQHTVIALMTTGLPESRKIPRFTPRLVSFKLQTAGTSPDFDWDEDIASQYISVFSEIPPLGSFVGVKLWIIGTITGTIIEVPVQVVEVV
jgi:hypothetical protein